MIGLSLSIFTFNTPDLRGSITPEIYTETQEEEKSRKISVEIIGVGITRPGSYRMSADSTVIDLVQAAGGVKTGAITDTIDWHANLYDGLRLTVPTHEILEEVRVGTRTLRDQDLIRFRHVQEIEPDTRYININQATAAQLKTLPGIGDVLAHRIIQYRDREGPFRKKEAIKGILGIGEVTYQELRSKISVR